MCLCPISGDLLHKNDSGLEFLFAFYSICLLFAGIHQFIPFDEMLDTMYAVGRRIPIELRETALGGCAATPSACAKCGLCS